MGLEEDFDSDDEYFDVRTPLQITRTGIYHIACRRWRELEENIKDAWGSRANTLNQRPVAGKFISIPVVIRNDDIMDGMTRDWSYTVNVFKNAVLNKRRDRVCQREYVFGGERVKVLSQKYRVFYISHLLQVIIFGQKFMKLTARERYKVTPRQVTIHIASYHRMKEMFTLNGLSSVRFEGNELNLCCGKVSLLDTSKRSIIGYIMNEDSTNLYLHLQNNLLVTIQRPMCVNGKYILNYISNSWEIVEYYPVRMQITAKGRAAMLFNVATFIIADGNYIIRQ